MSSYPTLAEFLAAPQVEVAKMAPPSVAYGAGGTRRAAVFAGIEPWSSEFMIWAHERMLDSQALLFQYGVQHVFSPLIVPNNVKEVHRHRDQLFRQIEPVLAHPAALARYRALGIRVRLLGGEQVPAVQATAEKLDALTAANGKQTLYWTVVLEPNDPWTQIFAAVHATNARTRAEAIRALYGEDIPLITLYLNHGKPEFSFNTLPPLLLGQAQCYWNQRPGSQLDESLLRTIFYDYAYLRTTFQADKLTRARAALAHQQQWVSAPMLGLGMRLGPFWHPAPTTLMVGDEAAAGVDG
ncbi:MAG: hypothetical protein KF832_25295 [Caldilineaceae bacterium]|nr:hypothetical protein [Caldilineaceae bacterium]